MVQTQPIPAPTISSAGFKLTLNSMPFSSIAAPLEKSDITQFTNASSLGWRTAHESNASPDLDERLERLRNQYHPSNEISQSVCFSSPEPKPLVSQASEPIYHHASEPVAKTPAYYFQERMNTPSPPKKRISLERRQYNTSVKKASSR